MNLYIYPDLLRGRTQKPKFGSVKITNSDFCKAWVNCDECEGLHVEKCPKHWYIEIEPTSEHSNPELGFGAEGEAGSIAPLLELYTREALLKKVGKRGTPPDFDETHELVDAALDALLVVSGVDGPELAAAEAAEEKEERKTGSAHGRTMWTGGAIAP